MKTIAQQLNIKEFPFEIKDKNGNVIYCEYSNGCWYRWEYDSNGKVAYFENYKGHWYKKEYDSNGNVIYCEYSYGYWCKCEYDSNGNRIYSEDSNGHIEDSRPKSCEGKVVEIDGKKYKLTEFTS